MAKAVLCPVCDGSGRVHEPLPEGSTGSYDYYRTCHGCGGKGWIEISESPVDLGGRQIPNTISTGGT